MKAPILATLVALALPFALAAGDGVLEIHEACVATGCFPGDTAGYPVKIASSGSYRLTSDLALTDENTVGIQIYAEGVTLDLGGFEIAGVTTCNWTLPGAVTCSPTGLGAGIEVQAKDFRVRNGTLRGTGHSAIFVGGSGTLGSVEDLRVAETGDHGLFLGSASVYRSQITLTAGDGALTGGTVDGCHVQKTGGRGINASIVRNSIVVYTASDGMATSLATGNSVREAVGFGLLLGPSAGYGGNTVSGNNGGNSNPQVSGGHEIATNVCGTDTTCP